MPEYSPCAECNCFPCACSSGYTFKPNAYCHTCHTTPCVCHTDLNDSSTTDDPYPLHCKRCWCNPCICEKFSGTPTPCSNCGAMSCLCKVSDGTHHMCMFCGNYYLGENCECMKEEDYCSKCEKYKAIINILMEDDF